MITSTDQLRRKISLSDFPVRIISLVPSQTELLFDLELNEEVIGITKFCIHPEEWFRTKERIGGTKNLNLEKIKSLKPDLIIANKEENDETQVGILMNDFPVWISDIRNLSDGLGMIREISLLVNRKNSGEKLLHKINSEFEKLKLENGELISCAYLIWKNPMMTIGGDTFISEMLKYSGFKNVFTERKRYPEILLEDLKNKNPETIFLSSEPYPFKDKDILELRSHLPEANVILVDGEMFSWYGSHLLKAPSYFLQLQEKMKSAS